MQPPHATSCNLMQLMQLMQHHATSCNLMNGGNSSQKNPMACATCSACGHLPGVTPEGDAYEQCTADVDSLKFYSVEGRCTSCGHDFPRHLKGGQVSCSADPPPLHLVSLCVPRAVHVVRSAAPVAAPAAATATLAAAAASVAAPIAVTAPVLETDSQPSPSSP